MRRGKIRVGSPSLALFCFLAAWTASGCSFGPLVLHRSHGIFNEAVEHVYEEQLLLNLVHLRYHIHPSRLEVSAIADQYQLSANAQATPFYTATAATMSNVIRGFAAVLPGGQVLGANNPTLTLTPADDRETVRRFLTPLPAETLFFIAKVGWPISTVFRLYVDSLNGIPNAPEATGPVRDILPRFEQFQHIANLIQIIQDRDYARIATEETLTPKGDPMPLPKDGSPNLVEAAKEGYEYVIHPNRTEYHLAKRSHKLFAVVNPLTRGEPEMLELVNLLHLQPSDKFEFKSPPEQVYPDLTSPQLQTSVEFVPRSTIQALFYLSRGVMVPLEHLSCGLAKATVGPNGEVFDWTRVTEGMFLVRSCKQHCRPAHAAVAVKYHDYWFYIDDRDQESKATFFLMMELVRYNLGDVKYKGPILTLPVSR